MKEVLFSELVEVFEKLERTSSGIEIRLILSSYLKQLSSSIDQVAYLFLGSIAPEYKSVKLGLAEKSVLTILEDFSGKHLERSAKKLGDLGLLAESVVSRRKSSLTVSFVFESFHKIAILSGGGSVERKACILKQLLERASPTEAKFIVRIVLSKLRLGVAEKTVIDSLSLAFAGSRKAKQVIEAAYQVCPDIGLIAKIASKNVDDLRKIKIEIGRPVKMMLAERAESVKEIVDRMKDSFSVEEKYDGERVQAHSDGKNVWLFSRRLENITSQFPDIVGSLKQCIGEKKFIIEGEIVAFHNGKLLPFQLLMQRRRKYEVESFKKKIPTRIYVFDILLRDKEVVSNKSYPERRKILESVVSESQNVALARQSKGSTSAEVGFFFKKALSRGCEGVIVKSHASNSFYQAGKRGFFWIKWKKEYVKELQDTFDLVVIGAFYGRGRRAGSYGALLCAAYNDNDDVFESFCKLGSGFSDKDLAELPRLFTKTTKQSRVRVFPSMEPDVWFVPSVVVEVLGAEVTHSPNHACGFSKGKGLALRFPRFVRWRHDKSPEQATTVKEVVKFYAMKR